MQNPYFRPAAGAFHTVPARHSFAQPPQPNSSSSNMPSVSPNNPTPAAKATRDWPDQVRSYVSRAFASENAIPEVARADMETRLKEVIGRAAESNTLLTIDWASLPLPQQMIIQERKSQAGMNLWTHGVAPLTINETNQKVNELQSSKKRKSSEMDHTQTSQAKIPPWRQTNTQNVFESRVSFPDKRPKPDTVGKKVSKSEKLAARQKRFDYSSSAAYVSPNKVPSPVPDVDQGPVVGRCQVLEKKYFRLTSAPNPDTVRPLPVLEKTFDFLKKKWRMESNYGYICDQFKSLRQDLTVQHIKNEFTVNVYEVHARIALEKGDLGEYNQCQTQLRALYSQHLGGHPEEFKAYRILYFIHTCNRTDMNDVLADLTPTEKSSPAIKHALDARSALALGNYHRFFKLYLTTPNMGAYLMDMFVARERLVALSNMCTSYKADVKLRFLTEELGFESDDESARFVCDHGGESFLEQKEDGDVRVLTGKAIRSFETAKNAAFRKVDIKGQI